VTIRGIPQEVSLGTQEGLNQASVANLDTVHVVAKARLRDRLGEIAPPREREVKRALGLALGWTELMVL
jgi:mRNA-degrading endonuclease toxin of MazEF toxin-antitoxin module